MNFMLCTNVKMIKPFIIEILRWILMQMHFNENANAKLFLMVRTNDDVWVYERCRWMQRTDDINFKLMHWMIKQLRHQMHKHNTYISMYKSYNTHW